MLINVRYYNIVFLNSTQVLRNALQRAQGELVDRYWSPPPGLQQWLQLTHEIENKAYIQKKASADSQLEAAKDAVSILVLTNRKGEGLG